MDFSDLHNSDVLCFKTKFLSWNPIQVFKAVELVLNKL